MPLRCLTAGESHGQALTAVLDGFPAGLPIERKYVDDFLARRQMGHGRGGRMRIENDVCEFLAGVRHGFTLGSPISIHIRNRDWANWHDTMSPDPAEAPESAVDRAVTRPRPGHADLTGGLKYGHSDLRNVLERASARETAARVGAGAFALRMLELLGVVVTSHVNQIGTCKVPDSPSCSSERHRALLANRCAADASPVRCLDADAAVRMMLAIDEAKAAGDSLGGTFEVVVFGLPPGIGSYSQWDRKLDGRIAMALMSVQAIKGVEFGLGFAAALTPGSEVHDAIDFTPERGFHRMSNRAGGVEGGMSNGETLVVRAAMKPIPTLYAPLASVDILTRQPFTATVERSDICAVPAAAVVGEAVVAWALADAMLEKLGGDTLGEVQRNLAGYLHSLGDAWRPGGQLPRGDAGQP